MRRLQLSRAGGRGLGFGEGWELDGRLLARLDALLELSRRAVRKA